MNPNRRFIEIEHFPEARCTHFNIGKIRIAIALGHFTCGFSSFNYWAMPWGLKKTISTKHFWLCLIER